MKFGNWGKDFWRWGARASVAASQRSGSVAVEFALSMPIFIALLFGTFALGSIVSTTIALQQLVAEGARASVGGLSDAERGSLARSFIAASVAAYPSLDASRLAVSTATAGGSPASFSVTVTYDMSHSIAYALAGLVPLPPPTISRTATVTNGGY